MHDILQQSLHTGMFDSNAQSNENLRPRLILNNHKEGMKVISQIEQELTDTESFIFSVAFVTQSGLAVLKQSLIELQQRGIKGQILTSDYLRFTEPTALTELLKFDNLEVKIISNQNFHAKRYIFKKKDNYSIIIGSSNMTASALTHNTEWNLKLSALSQGSIIQETLTEFERNWDYAQPVTSEWIQKYDVLYQKQKEVQKNIIYIHDEETSEVIIPNEMQVEALLGLQNVRNSGENRALIVSATGTGKTFLSAFDVRNEAPQKFLFIVHRETILDKSIESFQKVLGAPRVDFGKLVGGAAELDKKYLFASIQSLTRDATLQKIAKDAFDYIIIDEAHRSGANSYLKIIDYFTPKFLLGMTATPERNDGINIFELFDYNLAYEIRLQQALAYNLLCPFHYYGITDFIIDDEVEDLAAFNRLFINQRVTYILEKLDLYGYSGNKVRGLVFCSNNAEALLLSDKFNTRGFKTIALSGESSNEAREQAIQSLESDDGYDYIFTRDIFNEGIDIPSVNQVVMLRSTESSIIFVQQLGRGLRKDASKEYVIVVDFIGNYLKEQNNNYMIPVALSGDKTYNKEQLIKYTMESNAIIPGESSIHFDQISKERIFQSIRNSTFNSQTFLKKEYESLKYKLGHIPTLPDFIHHGGIDPQLIFSKATYPYYEIFLDKMKEDIPTFSEAEAQLFTFISKELSNGKRPHELILIKMCLDAESFALSTYHEKLDAENIRYTDADITSVLRVLDFTFFKDADQQKYGTSVVILTDGILYRSEVINTLLKDAYTRNVFEQLLAYSLLESMEYRNMYKDTNFVLYKQYSRKDYCRLINLESDDSGTLNGGIMKENVLPLFVNYDKTSLENDNQQYNDKFYDQQTFHWNSRATWGINSKQVQYIVNYKEIGMRVHLFITKEASTNGPSLMYYLGEVTPEVDKMYEMKLDNGTSLVTHVEFTLETPVVQNMYDYFITNEEE